MNFTRSDTDIIEGIVSHTIDEDKSSFTDDLSDSGPLTYIPSLSVMDEGKKWLKSIHSMICQVNFLFFCHNLVDVIAMDVKHVLAIHPLEHISTFEKNHASI